MSITTKAPKFHVVCRECSVEQLFETDGNAVDFEQTHAAKTGHRVAVGRVC